MSVDTATASITVFYNTSNLLSIFYTKIEKTSTSFYLAKYLNGAPSTKARSNSWSFFPFCCINTVIDFCLRICFSSTIFSFSSRKCFYGIIYAELLIAATLLMLLDSSNTCGNNLGYELRFAIVTVVVTVNNSEFNSSSLFSVFSIIGFSEGWLRWSFVILEVFFNASACWQWPGQNISLLQLMCKITLCFFIQSLSKIIEC